MKVNAFSCSSFFLLSLIILRLILEKTISFLSKLSIVLKLFSSLSPTLLPLEPSFSSVMRLFQAHIRDLSRFVSCAPSFTTPMHSKTTMP